MHEAGVQIGTPLSPGACRVLLLGSGELGKELAIEAQRLGIEVIAADRYPNAPAMQVAHQARVLELSDPAALEAAIREIKPDLVVPEIEAIATSALLAVEADGQCVVPTARATDLTMNRERIRRLAAEVLGLPTSRYAFANSADACLQAVRQIGVPCFIKPTTSSSGHGQSRIEQIDDAPAAFTRALAEARGDTGTVIVEGQVEFDFEITLLTVRHAGGTLFCEPIRHTQVDGDYRESWQGEPLSPEVQARAESVARSVTDELGGLGVFGVELFIAGDDVLFSEVSPRPHDTGLVTLCSQDLSQFALHVRAILGLPIPGVDQLGPAASAAFLVEQDIDAPVFAGLEAALSVSGTTLRLFGKPGVRGRRRMGVALARGNTVADARSRARAVVEALRVTF